MDLAGSREAASGVSAETWMNSLALARLATSALGGHLLETMNTLVELLVALIWTVYYVIEAGVKHLLPSHLFHKDVAGQIVLITGGGSGIGRLMCLKFAKLGAHVVTWDINSKGNEETVELVRQQGLKATGFTVDMSNKQEIYEAAKLTKAEVGTVSILVNNAGIVSGTALLDTPDARIVKTFEVNVLAHFWTIKAFLPDMLDQQCGHIVNLASVAGQAGTNKLVDYCASKFACVGLDEALRVELAVQGNSQYIKTTVVCPYYISTGMFSGVSSKIIPILEPDFVATSVVDATLANKEIVLLPWWTTYLFMLKHLLPSQAMMKLASAFGANCSMDQFTGRDKMV